MALTREKIEQPRCEEIQSPPSREWLSKAAESDKQTKSERVSEVSLEDSYRGKGLQPTCMPNCNRSQQNRWGGSALLVCCEWCGPSSLCNDSETLWSTG